MLPRPGETIWEQSRFIAQDETSPNPLVAEPRRPDERSAAPLVAIHAAQRIPSPIEGSHVGDAGHNVTRARTLGPAMAAGAYATAPPSPGWVLAAAASLARIRPMLFAKGTASVIRRASRTRYTAPSTGTRAGAPSTV